MTAPLPEVVESGVECYRVGRHPDPLAHAPHHAQPWDGRYDDPDRVSRTLYFADSAYGAWVEVLARFRPEPGLRDALERIVGEDDDPPGPSFGVELRWLATRAVAHVTITGRLARVTDARTLAWLDAQLRDDLAARDLDQVDLAAATGPDRALTQRIARALRLHADIEGLAFTSRHGDDITCYAVFEASGGRPHIDTHSIAGVSLSGHNDAFERARALHGLPFRDEVLSPGSARPLAPGASGQHDRGAGRDGPVELAGPIGPTLAGGEYPVPGALSRPRVVPLARRLPGPDLPWRVPPRAAGAELSLPGSWCPPGRVGRRLPTPEPATAERP